ncbi:MAG: permease [Patescibacteria group bacterium]|nr:permease [Patescibacteria group bacterium]
MNDQIKKQKIGGGTKFLMAVLILYAVMALSNFQFASEAFLSFLHMLVRIIPILMVVFFVMMGINLYFIPERVKKYLGHGSGLSGWLYAIIFGILISAPPYIFFPLLGRLKERGMKNSLIAVILYNRNVKIPFLPVMVFYFGLSFTVAVSVFIIFFSILNGLLLGWWVADNQKIYNEEVK